MSLKRFSITGVINTLFGLLIIYIAKLSGLDDVSSNVIGYSCGILLSFRLNSSWTFGYKGCQVRAFFLFIIVVCVAYFINLGVVLIAIHYFFVNAYIAQSLGIVPYALITYFGSKHIAFVNKA